MAAEDRRLPPDGHVVLAYVGVLLGECRQRSVRNGLAWSVQLEAAWLLATGRQEPPEFGSGSHLPDVVAVTYSEAARRLSVSERTVERLIGSGALPAVAIGGCPRIRATDLTAYVEGRPVRTAGCGDHSSAQAVSERRTAQQ